MAITVKVVCYKSKVLSNNESPLMLRVTKDRKPKYVSLGISVNPTHWDFSKNQPKTECPNREYIEMLIADKIKEYSAKIIELKATNQEFTSTSPLAYKQSKQKKIKMTYMEKKEFGEIEDIIMDLETNLSQIEEKMNGVTDFKEIDKLSKQRDDLQKQIDEKNERYLYLLELQEQIDNQ